MSRCTTNERASMGERWRVLLILCFARTAMGLHLQVAAAVAPYMMADLALTYGEIGALIGVFLLPGVLLAIPGGLIGRRFGDTHTLSGGLVLLLIGTGMLAVVPGFWSALGARALAGAGGVLLTMQVAKIATDWFAGRELSTAFGLMMGTFPLGIAAVMAGLPLISNASSWRTAVALVSVVALLILVAVLLVLRDHPAARRAAAERPRLWDISRAEAGLAALSGAAFSLLNAGLVIFMSFTPTLLLGRGLDQVQAGWLTSWASWVGMLTLPAAGLLLDRAPQKTVWLLATSVASALLCWLVPTTEPAALWIVLFALTMAPVAVASMALPGEVLRPESRSIGLGIFFTTNYIGFGLLPAVAGALVDWTGSAAAPLWFDGVVFAAIVPIALLFRRLQRSTARAAAATAIRQE